jgi:hypothetical protein
MLEDLYNDIKQNPILWQDGSAGKDDGPERSLTEEERQQRHRYHLLVRKGLAFLKNHCAVQRSFHSTESVDIVRALFEVSWFRFVAAMTTLIDNTSDVDVLQVCLDGLSYGACVAIMLQMHSERNAFMQVMTKVAFRETFAGSREQYNRALATHEHLNLDWNKAVTLQSRADPAGACRTLVMAVHDVKQKLSFERHQEVLRLVAQHRKFIREQLLTKLTQGMKRKDYHFFLFNDVLLYAEQGINAKFKVHRVLHLAFCRLVDQKPSKASGERPSLRIVSPQKSFVVEFRDAAQKREWLELLKRCITDERTRRDRYFESVKFAKVRERFRRKGDETFVAQRAQLDDEKAADVSVRGNESPESSDEDASARVPPAPSHQGSANRLNLGSLTNVADDSDVDIPGHELTAAAAYAQLAAGDASDDREMLKRYALFVSQELAEARGGPRPFCAQCLRNFSVFRRRHACQFCKDTVCSDCLTKKCLLPGDSDPNPQRVCDICFGALRRVGADDLPVVADR